MKVDAGEVLMFGYIVALGGTMLYLLFGCPHSIQVKNEEATLSNPFKSIGHFFENVVGFVISPAGRKKIAAALGEAQKLIAPALDACSMIAALTPTRSDDEIVVLAQRYSLGVITPEMITNNAIVSGILKHAAMVELQRITGSGADPRVLDLAIQSAYLVYKQAAHDVAHAESQQGEASVLTDGPRVE